MECERCAQMDQKTKATVQWASARDVWLAGRTAAVLCAPCLRDWSQFLMDDEEARWAWERLMQAEAEMNYRHDTLRGGQNVEFAVYEGSASLWDKAKDNVARVAMKWLAAPKEEASDA